MQQVTVVDFLQVALYVQQFRTLHREFFKGVLMAYAVLPLFNKDQGFVLRLELLPTSIA